MTDDEAAQLRSAAKAHIWVTRNLLDALVLAGVIDQTQAWAYASDPVERVKDPELRDAWKEAAASLQ